MAMVRASCPECGDVELTTRDLSVVLNTTTYESHYSFICPVDSHPKSEVLKDGTVVRMGRLVIKPAEPRVVDVLLAAGIELQVFNMAPAIEEHEDGMKKGKRLGEDHEANRRDLLDNFLEIGILDEQQLSDAVKEIIKENPSQEQY